MKLFIASVLLWFYAADHDVKMARFRVEEAGAHYEIFVSFDRVDILETIYAYPTSKTEVIDQISDYVKSRVSYRIDGQPVPFEFKTIEYTRDNIFLKGEIQVPPGSIDRIEVENTCLIHDIDGHLNIMEFFINDNQRYFRLHEGRTKTIVSYE